MRYRFARDDDGHWYLVPESISVEEWEEWVHKEDSVVDLYRINGGPENYTFTSPKERI